MLVSMMRIRKMRMRMRQALVAVRVCMTLARSGGRRMIVLVMLVVNVLVFVLERLVRVLMLVTLREVQPDARAHQCTGKE